MSERKWLGGMVGAMVLCGLSSPAWAKADLTVTYDTSSATCEEHCFDVSSDKNITHLFFLLEFCIVDPPFVVTVDNVRVSPIPDRRFKHKGGPCNHDGEPLFTKSADRWWIPLWGNQEEARVCISSDEPFDVWLGAKSGGECEQDVSTCNCTPAD